jgi:hypothetical protein
MSNLMDSAAGIIHYNPVFLQSVSMGGCPFILVESSEVKDKIDGTPLLDVSMLTLHFVCVTA